MTYEEFKQDALVHLKNASKTNDKTTTSYYLKTYTDEDVDLMREHCKGLEGDELIEELKVYLDCGNPNTNSPYFKEFMREYRSQLLEIWSQSVNA